MKDCVAALVLSEWIAGQQEARKSKVPWWRPEIWRLAEEMQGCGVDLDAEAAVRVAKQVQQQRDTVEQAITSMAPGLNPASHMQVKRVLYEEKGIKPIVVGGKKTTGMEALHEIWTKTKEPLVKALLQRVKLTKLASSFLEPMVQAGDVMRCGWTPDATKTFRWASSKHPCGGGLNLQTMPSSLRCLVCAPTGRVFIQPDLAQAEDRYVVWRSGNTKEMPLYGEQGRNVHLERARELFGREVEKGSADYLLAKKTKHAQNYLMGPRRLSMMASIPLVQAKQLLNKGAVANPWLGRWHKEVAGLAHKGLLCNTWGQERQCFEALGGVVVTGVVPESVLKDCVAWEPQSSIPQIINQAMVTLAHSTEVGWQWHVHGHDSFLASVATKDVEFAVKEALLALAIPMQVGGRELIIPVDMQVGWTWGQLVPWGTCGVVGGAGWQERWACTYPGPVQGEEVVKKALEALLFLEEAEL